MKPIYNEAKNDCLVFIQHSCFVSTIYVRLSPQGELCILDLEDLEKILNKLPMIMIEKPQYKHKRVILQEGTNVADEHMDKQRSEGKTGGSVQA